MINPSIFLPLRTCLNKIPFPLFLIQFHARSIDFGSYRNAEVQVECFFPLHLQDMYVGCIEFVVIIIGSKYLQN